MNRPLVIQTEHLDDEPAAWLAERARVERCSADDPHFSSLLCDALGLVIRTYTRVDERLLEQAPKLRVIGRAGVGLDNIDLDACQRAGVQVVHTPDANTQAVVEYVLRLMLDHIRPICPPLTSPIGDERWKTLRQETLGSQELAELTVGIVGLGRIGSRLARALAGIGASVLYNDLLDIPDAQACGAQRSDLKALFATSDIVSIHVDGRASNRRMIAGDLLNRLRSDALLLNTSRGFVIDTGALADALRAEPGRRAILDVHDPEPIVASNPLLGLPNAVLLPHLASRTQTAMRNMSWVVRDVWAVLQGEQPRWPAALKD